MTDKISDIPVVILCGGKGTRLREETENVPKPLVKIGDRPIIWHILKLYHAQGYRKFVLLLGYKGDKIKEYFLNYNYYANSFTLKQRPVGASITYLTHQQENWDITFLDTGLETLTGARIKQLQPLFKKEKRFLLTYGDGVADVDIKRTIMSHIKSKAKVTLTGVPPLARFGEIREDRSGKLRFFEKPQITGTFINGGFMVVETSILKSLPANEDLNFEMDVLPKLAETDVLNVVPHNGYWQCMDTVRDMELLNTKWAEDNAPWKIW